MHVIKHQEKAGKRRVRENVHIYQIKMRFPTHKSSPRHKRFTANFVLANDLSINFI